MFLIDFYSQQLKRQNASQITLKSGEFISLQLPEGEKQSTSAIIHSQVVQLVEEIASPGDWQQLKASGSVSFDYPASGSKVGLSVNATDDQNWHVTITPGGVVTARAEATLEQTEPSTMTQASPTPEPVATSESFAAPQSQVQAPVAAPQALTPQASVPQASVPHASAPQTQSQPSVSVALKSQGEPAINAYLRKMIEVGASDLHMSSEATPLVRLGGEIQPLDGDTKLSSLELNTLLMAIAPEQNQEEFAETWDTDFAHSIPGLARFRANYFMDRHGVGAVFRQIPFEILKPDVLGLPKEVLDLCWLSKGLVLVTGPTGSGKSTTLASLIDYVNENRNDHIITIEDPIEFVHQNKKCLVNQREVGTHTQSFKKALRAALREDPDIVLVGELRDLETIAIAVETAETGHLVFGTLHTTTAPSTVDRIIDQFPGEQQAQIRMMLAESLKGVISQVLCKKEGGGRAAAYEILLANSAISNNIREGKTFQLSSAMQTGKKQGMCTMNDSLLQLVVDGKVSAKEAYIKSVDKQGLQMMLQSKGIKVELDHQVA